MGPAILFTTGIDVGNWKPSPRCA